MTRHHKPAPLPEFKPGDIVSLQETAANTLALVMEGDYKAGELKGIYYFPIQAMSKKEYRGNNVEGERHHLSLKDLASIREATKRGEYRLDPKSVFRLDYEITHVDFNEQKLPEIYFIKYASTGTTKFFQNAIRQYNKILLERNGLGDDVKDSVYKALPRMRAPSHRETTKSSGVTVKDISLIDAVDPAFIDDNPYISPLTFDTLMGIGSKKYRPETLKQAFEMVTLIQNDEKAKTAFVKSFDKHARGNDVTMAEMYADIKAGWVAFASHIVDPQYDMSSVKTDYPARRNG